MSYLFSLSCFNIFLYISFICVSRKIVFILSLATFMIWNIRKRGLILLAFQIIPADIIPVTSLLVLNIKGHEISVQHG